MGPIFRVFGMTHLRNQADTSQSQDGTRWVTKLVYSLEMLKKKYSVLVILHLLDKYIHNLCDLLASKKLKQFLKIFFCRGILLTTAVDDGFFLSVSLFLIVTDIHHPVGDLPTINMWHMSLTSKKKTPHNRSWAAV